MSKLQNSEFQIEIKSTTCSRKIRGTIKILNEIESEIIEMHLYVECLCCVLRECANFLKDYVFVVSSWTRRASLQGGSSCTALSGRLKRRRDQVKRSSTQLLNAVAGNHLRTQVSGIYARVSKNRSVWQLVRYSLIGFMCRLTEYWNLRLFWNRRLSLSMIICPSAIVKGHFSRPLIECSFLLP